MTHPEFVEWLTSEVTGGRMTTGERQDLLEQKGLFDRQQTLLREQYRNRIVGYVAGNLRSAGEIHELLDAANAGFPGRMIYFEAIGFDLF